MICTVVFCAVTLCNPDKLAPAEMLPTFIWEIPDLNPSQDTSYPDTVHGSPLPIQANADSTLSQMMATSFHNLSNLSIHIMPQSVLWIALLNKPQMSKTDTL